MNASRAAKERSTRHKILHMKQAELLAELARVNADIATVFASASENDTEVTSPRKPPVKHVPRLEPVSEVDQARARKALRDVQLRRRLRA